MPLKIYKSKPMIYLGTENIFTKSFVKDSIGHFLPGLIHIGNWNPDHPFTPHHTSPKHCNIVAEFINIAIF